MVPSLIVFGILPAGTHQICVGIGQSTQLWDEELSERFLAQYGGALTEHKWDSASGLPLKRPQDTFETAGYGRS